MLKLGTMLLLIIHGPDDEEPCHKNWHTYIPNTAPYLTVSIFVKYLAVKKLQRQIKVVERWHRRFWHSRCNLIVLL